MLVQEAMIARLRALCQRDTRVAAALLYGSFTTGEGDAYSDIEAAVFVADDALPLFDQRAWVARIAPVALYFADDFGHQTAIFTNLVRGEFHVEPASAMTSVASWRGNAWFPDLDTAVLVDRTGQFAQHLRPLAGAAPDRDTPACARHLADNFVNGVVFGTAVLARGEVARALEVLSGVHRNLLWMARLVEQATAHWPTPARAVERDLSGDAYARYVACTAPAQPGPLWAAYRVSWIWGKEMMQALAHRHHLPVPTALLARIDRRVLE